MRIDELNETGINEEWDDMKLMIYSNQGYCCEKCGITARNELEIHVSEFENGTDPCTYRSMAYRVLCRNHNAMQNEKCKDNPDWERVRELNIKAIKESKRDTSLHAK